jgi:hypothetical protein
VCYWGYPWSIEFNENILVVIEDDVIVTGSNDDGDGTFLFFGHWFTLDAGQHASIEITGDELLNLGGCDFLGLIVRILCIFGNILNCECRPRLFPKILIENDRGTTD